MSYKDCIDAITKAAGRELSDEEADAIFTEIERRVREEVSRGFAKGDAYRKAGMDLSKEMQIAISIERRSAKINALRWSELQGRHVVGRENEVVEATLSGYNGRLGRGRADFQQAGNSVDAQGHAAVLRSLGALADELEQAGLLDALNRGDREFHKDVAREMWRIIEPDSAPETGNKHARTAAEILYKHKELARLEQNAAGASIGKLDHHIGTQAHDKWLVRGTGDPKVAFEKWREVIEPRLKEESFAGVESPSEKTRLLEAYWRAIWSGQHGPAKGEEALTGYKGWANLAKQVSHSRKLHFKSADAWMEYNEIFGQKTVLSSVVSDIERGQRNAAVMRVMGTNPKAMLDRLISEWTKEAKIRGDITQTTRLTSEAAKHQRILDLAMGMKPHAVNETMSSWGKWFRDLQLFKLGSSLFSSFNDIGNIVATARHNGIGAFESATFSVANLLPTGPGARREAAHQIGFLTDTLGRISTERIYTADGPHGRTAEAAQVFMKFTGLPYWTEKMKEAVGHLWTHNIARSAKTAFEKLDRRFQVTLRRYGIEKAEWDVLRQVKQTKVGDYHQTLPHSVLELPDEAVAHLSSQGPERARQVLYDKYSTYIIDQSREALSEPTAAVKDFVTGGSYAPGTFWGEAIRAVMQFKTFTATFMMRSMAREFMRSGVDPGGVAQLVVLGTAFGYLSMTMKEIAKGREPRIPETFEDRKNLVIAAMAQGGGLGIYGDFLLGQSNRYGASLANTAAGPMFGTFDAFWKAWLNFREDGTQHLGSDFVDIVKQLPPASATNLWFTRAGADYLIFWQVQEALNPGWASRYEQRVERENSQKFIPILSPTRAVQ